MQQAVLPEDAALNRELLQWIANDGLLNLAPTPLSDAQAQTELRSGRARFILYLPAQPSSALHKGEQLPLRLVADFSDPAMPSVAALLGQVLADASSTVPGASRIEVQPRSYRVGNANLTLEPKFALPRGSGSYLVPALAGVILTLTLTLMAAFSLVRELERGTWDGLLSTPASALAIVLGKLLPYAVLGLALFAVLQWVAHLLFGSAFASLGQWLSAICFVLGQLGLGACLSLLARTQMQAMQLGVLFYLPSILLSGFMFPFHAMPVWAKTLGELLPLTHFLRVLRADLFRQAELPILLALNWPIVWFASLVLGLAIMGYRRRLM